MTNLQNWFCLADNGDLYFLGHFDSYENADFAAQKQGHEAIWLINEESAKKWQKIINAQIKG